MTARHPFDALAPHYRWLEGVSFGPLLHWCRTTHLPLLGEGRRVLVVGDGDGRFLADLLTAHPAVTADAADISPRMTALARRRTAFAADRVRFAVGDIRRLPLPPGGYDLIVTNFLLDCFPPDQLAEVVAKLATAAAPNARWLVGDFAEPPGRWSGRAARLALAGMYAFFRVVARLPARRLTDPSPLLTARGFTPEAEATRLGGFLVARLWRRGEIGPAAVCTRPPSGG